MSAKKYYNPNNFNAVHAGAAYLSYWGMMIVVSVLVAAVTGGGEDMDEGAYLTLNILFTSVGLLAVTGIFCAIARVRPLNGGGFLVRKGCGMECLMAFVTAFGMAALLFPVANSFGTAGDYIGEALSSQGGSSVPVVNEVSGLLLLYMFVLTPVLPAIFEELLFRGVIMRGFLQFGRVPAVVLSALMFALAHGSYQQFIYQFLLALVIGFLVLETKNLFIGMVVHFANNLFSSVGQFPQALVLSSEGLSADAMLVYLSIVQIMYCLIGAVCVIAAAVYFGKRMLHMQRVPERARGDIRAAFVVNDMVSGTLTEEVPWYDCGTLTPAGAERKSYLSGARSRGKLNAKSGFVASAVLIGLGLLVGLGMFVFSFYI